jgi:GT2 family glycosyltransferase/Tfp pilus assembly protein PilF/SAM-dependent methyltransferase
MERESLNKEWLGENLIFLISQPRSGSTLLQRLIAGHPEVHSVAEPWIMLHPLYALKREGIKTEYDSSLASQGLEDFLTQIPEGVELYIEALRNLGSLLYNKIITLSQKRYFLDKTPRYYYIIPELYRVFPNAKFIFLFRNPLAVMSSTLSSWFGNKPEMLKKSASYNDLTRGPHYLTEGVKLLGNNGIVVHYEELVKHPKEVIQDICSKIGIAFHEKMLEYGQNQAPKGRFGDSVRINNHSRSVTDYVDKWIENLGGPKLNDCANEYLSLLGPSVISAMGYSYQELKKKLNRPIVVSEPGAKQKFSQAALCQEQNSVVVSTSLAPREIEIQSKAVESWINLGFKVFSINCQEEIGLLRESFPQVTFFEAKRNGKTRFGKPYIYFDDFLLFFKKFESNICGIINSDNILFSDIGLVSFIQKHARNSLVYGSRVEIKSLDNLDGDFYDKGFDFFFFDKSIISCFPESETCIGVTWWDYWAAIIPALEGIEIKKLVSPLAYHITHQNRWDEKQWHYMGKSISGHLYNKWCDNNRLLTNNNNPLRIFNTILYNATYALFLNRELGPEERVKISYEMLSRFAISILAFLEKMSTTIKYKSDNDRIKSGNNSPRSTNGNHIVKDLNNKGEELLRKGNLKGALQQFLGCIEIEPVCSEAHSNLGLTYWKIGDSNKALLHFKTALEIEPNDEVATLFCGKVLMGLGKYEEARILYSYFLLHDPGNFKIGKHLSNIESKILSPIKSDVISLKDSSYSLSLRPKLADSHVDSEFEKITREKGWGDAKSMIQESDRAHQWLDGLHGVEIGPSAHNPFGLNTINVGLHDPIYEQEQINRVGKAAELDIVAKADDLPIETESKDFIITSHLIEHCPNFVKTLIEWFRVIKSDGYIFMITPHRSAAPSDVGKSLTSWSHLFQDYVNDRTPENEPEAGRFGHCHYHIFSFELMKRFIHNVFGDRLRLVDSQKQDDKDGTGFTLIYQKKMSINESFPWQIKSGQEVIDIRENYELNQSKNLTQEGSKIKVSAIVSTYNSEKFIRGCLKDLMEQSLYKKGKLEVIVVDSCSQQAEGSIVKEFQHKYSKIKYLRTERRETIYKAWNRAIKAASGEFITTSNTDDRHRIDALEHLADELEKYPDIGLVYADVFVTNFENQIFGKHIHCGYHIRPDYSPEIMLSGCHMGPQPMWRKSIHETVGYFSDEYQSAGDYDFWCRVALNYPMKHVPEFLGLYYENPKGFCNSKKALSIQETVSVQKNYHGSFPVPGKAEKYINNYQFPGYVEDKKYVNISMVTYNRLNFTTQSIESILKYTRFPFVITVIDNNSLDGTKEYLKKLHRNGIIKNLVILDENVGIAKASNLAWYHEQDAEYYLKFDNDIVIEKPDWLFNMVKAIDAIPELGAIAYNFEPYSYPLSTMNGIKFRIKKHNNLGGACILIPRRTRERLGFWCEDFGLYGEEDADYGERIRLKGLLNAYMEDEDIGLHLPGGRAARIDPETLNAQDGVEEIIHSEYREWKDNIRRQIFASGVFKKRIKGYRKGQYPLYIESKFTKKFLTNQNSLNQSDMTGLETELANAQNCTQISDPTHSIKTSIIIVTYNSSTDIKNCLESITKNTQLTYEIIIIDNCSSDSTRDLLKTLRKVKIILNPVNLGFSKGCNQGIEVAKGEYIVLLNPDTVVTDKWDEKLISHFNDGVGAVGPLSNYVAGRQKYEFYTNKRLSTLKNIDSFSKNIFHQNKGKNKETKLLIGFCMMIKREVIDEVGMLDESLFLGNDDLDLSLRLRSNGYRLLVAIDTFIYHKGQASFNSEPTEKTKALVQESTNTLYQKLKEQYGDGRVPNSQELWDIGWFKPDEQVHTKTKLTSIIITTYNQLKFTEKCIESIFNYAIVPFELIVVDNGSSDGTVEYLESEVLGRNTAVRIKIIKNKENKGFAGGNNQGIAAATGDYILLLNNDTVVTPGWLELLINCAERNSKIGIVGPRSNYVSGPQLVEEVSYDTESLKGLSEFVKSFVDNYSGQIQRVLRVVGFCMLIKRRVIETIGGLDDRYGLGNFEDDDFSLRAAIAGFESWIAKDCFIHHFGSRTFIGANIDFSESLHNNWEIFKKKWGLPEKLPYGSPYSISQMPINGFDPETHYIPLPKREDYALNMLEKNYQIPEIMYHDLLSQVNTHSPEEVFKNLQKFVSLYPEFALAHNDLGVLCYNNGQKEEALYHYKKAIQLDPENMIFQKNLADFYYVELGNVEDALRIYVKILEANPEDVEILLITGHICVALERFQDAKVFYSRVLEIEPTHHDARQFLNKLNSMKTGNSEVKTLEELYREIQPLLNNGDPHKAIVALEVFLEKFPDFALAHNDLGVLCYHTSNKEKAQHHYERAVQLLPENIGFQKNLADFYCIELGRVEDALKIYVSILTTHPQDIETLMATGQICVAMEQLDDAKIFFKRVLDIEPWNTDARQNLDILKKPKSVDLETESPNEIYLKIQEMMPSLKPEKAIGQLEKLVESFPDFALAHNDLGVLYYNTGDKERALLCYQKAMDIEPENITFQKNLADFLYVVSGQIEEALQIYVDILSVHPEDVETLLITGHICVALKRIEDASNFYKRVLELQPGNEDAKETLEALRIYQKHNKSQVPAGDDISQDSIRVNNADGDYQTDIEATAADEQGYAVSIIVSLDGVQNRLNDCVKSVRQHTSESYEILLIDNGATKGIQKWAQRTVVDNSNCRLLKVGKNLSWSESLNQGLDAAYGEFVVILHNDVVVYDNWLSDMLECIHQDFNIGVVGPMTNNTDGRQQDINADYRSIDHFETYTKKFRKLNRNRRLPASYLSAFCLLFRRELVEQLGQLDENFRTEAMAVKDFCLRANYHGYRNVVAADVLIHHYDRHKARKDRTGKEKQLAQDRRIFKEKLNELEINNIANKKFQVLKILEQADQLNQKGQVDKAIDTLLSGIGLIPEDRRFFLALAEILIKAKRFQGALDTLNEISKVEDTEIVDSVNGADRLNHEPATGVSGSITLRDQEIKKLELLAYCEEGLENYKAAEEHAELVLSMNPSSANALNLKGILAYKQNEKELAEEFFNKAIESDPGYGEPYTNLGTLKFEVGQEKEALRFYERGFILDPTDFDVATLFHSTLSALSEFERAESIVGGACAMHPHNQKIKYMLIDILIHQEKHRKSMNEIEDAIIKFGFSDGILAAALKIRNQLGPMKINKNLKRPAVSLCMIVKNEEQYLAKCLASVKPIVDEMIVVDTGSTDQTRAIAEAFGAKVYDFEWNEDFAEARNFSISKASGGWIFIMDGDEVLSLLDHEEFKDIFKKKPKNPIAFTIVTRNYCTLANAVGWMPNDGKYHKEEASIGWVPSVKVRLFYGKEQIWFEGAVHEMVEPVLKRNGIPIKQCHMPIHHYGRLNKEKLGRKGEKYFEIGKKKLEEMGDDINAIREIAVQAAALGKNEEALDLWKRFLSLDPSPKLASEAYINIGTIYSRLGKFNDALLASKRALELTPDVKEANNNVALGKFYLGEVEQAIPIFEKLLKEFPGYLSAQFKLAAAYCCSGQKEKGKQTFELLRQSTRMGQNEMASACYDLAQGFVSAHRLDYAIDLLKASIENNYVNDDLLTLFAECLSKNNESRSTGEIVRQSIEIDSVRSTNSQPSG